MELSPSLWPIAAAPFIGSFLGVIATRIEAPRSIVFGRSICDSCRCRLGAVDLVPVVSWLALRGRCRRCGGQVGLFYPMIELAAVATALWAAMAVSGVALWISCLLGWALLTLAAIDVRHYLLPDLLTLPLLACGLLANWWLDAGSVLPDLIGVALGYGFIVALGFAYRTLRGREGIGMGDAKLLAACGAWVGWSGLPSVLLLAAVSGLVVTVLLRRGAPLTLSDRLPFGAYLCLGLWIVWLYGPLQIAAA